MEPGHGEIRAEEKNPYDMQPLRLSKGDSLAEVSKEMGHATTDMTYRTYYKWLPKERRSDIDELDDVQVTTPNVSSAKVEMD